MSTHCRFSADTLAYCGINTQCSNSHGSFSCPCNPGYQVSRGQHQYYLLCITITVHICSHLLPMLAAAISTSAQPLGGGTISGTTAGL